MNFFLSMLANAGIVMDEAGGDGAQGGGGAPAAPAAATEATVETTEDTKAVEAPEETAEQAPESPHAMDQYIEMHADNPAVSLALTFLRDNGISPEDPAFQMAEHEGNFDLLAAILEQKGAGGTDKFLGILKGAVEEYAGKVEAQEERTTEIVMETLGEDQGAVFEWVRANADPEEKQMINEMLACGGLAAKGAALVLRELYAAAGNTMAATKTVTHSNVNQNTSALSREAFTKEVTALGRKYSDPRQSPQYASLWQRRQQGMAQGI